MKKKEYRSSNGHLGYARIQIIVELWKKRCLSLLPQKIKKIPTNFIKTYQGALLKISLYKFTLSENISGIAISPIQAISFSKIQNRYKRLNLKTEDYNLRICSVNQGLPNYLRRVIK